MQTCIYGVYANMYIWQVRHLFAQRTPPHAVADVRVEPPSEPFSYETCTMSKLSLGSSYHTHYAELKFTLYEPCLERIAKNNTASVERYDIASFAAWLAIFGSAVCLLTLFVLMCHEIRRVSILERNVHSARTVLRLKRQHASNVVNTIQFPSAAAAA
jgi:hypothetical protein